MTEVEDRSRRLHAALRDIHWSAEALAGATGMRSDTARRIVAGKRVAPDWLLDWLELLAEAHRLIPLPPRPGQGPGGAVGTDDAEDDESG